MNNESCCTEVCAGRRKRAVTQPFNGFTLVEVMIVVAVIGILSAIAIPAILDWIPNIRLQSAARDLYSNMQLAKLQAIKTNRNVLFEVNPNAACLGHPGCPGGSCYRFYVDTNASGTCDAGDTVIMNVRMMNNLSVATPAPNNFVAGDGFRPTGLPTQVGNNKTAVVTHTQSTSVFRVTETVAGGVTLQRL